MKVGSVLAFLMCVGLMACSAANTDKANPKYAGIVFSFSGDLVLEKPGSPVKEAVTRNMPIPMNGVIKVNPDKASGNLKLVALTPGGFTNDYKSFPVRFSGVAFSDKAYDAVISSMGGGIVGTRGALDIFEWSAPVGLLDEAAVLAGQTLALSRTGSSLESKSVNPIVFKLKQGMRILKASFVVTETENAATIVSKGSFKLSNTDWVFDFASVPCKKGTGYSVKCVFIMETGDTVEWNFGFAIVAAETVRAWDLEAAKTADPAEDVFTNALLKASYYQEQKMKMKALEIRLKAGLPPGLFMGE